MINSIVLWSFITSDAQVSDIHGGTGAFDNYQGCPIVEDIFPVAAMHVHIRNDSEKV
jgi:hypothetical protein